jgi:hypothetical protein
MEVSLASNDDNNNDDALLAFDDVTDTISAQVRAIRQQRRHRHRGRRIEPQQILSYPSSLSTPPPSSSFFNNINNDDDDRAMIVAMMDDHDSNDDNDMDSSYHDLYHTLLTTNNRSNTTNMTTSSTASVLKESAVKRLWLRFSKCEPDRCIREIPARYLTEEIVRECCCTPTVFPRAKFIPLKFLLEMHMEILAANPLALQYIPDERVTEDMVLVTTCPWVFEDDPRLSKARTLAYYRRGNERHALNAAAMRMIPQVILYPYYFRRFPRLFRRILDAYYPTTTTTTTPVAVRSLVPLTQILHRPTVRMCAEIYMRSKLYTYPSSLGLSSLRVSAQEVELDHLSPDSAKRLKALMFALAMHQRCGKDSVASQLPEEIFEIICSMVMDTDANGYTPIRCGMACF